MKSNIALRKVLILCSRLDMPGGIERSVTNIANLLQSNGFDITILILDHSKELFYPINDRITIRQLPLNFGITDSGTIFSRKLSLLRETNILRKEIKQIQPAIILSTEYHFTIVAWFAKKRMHVRQYAREAFHFHNLDKNLFWKTLIRWIYKHLNGVICLNKDEALLYQKLGCKTFVVPNFISLVSEKSLQREKVLLTISRLSRTKGVDQIPSVAEIIFKENPAWKWIIIGNGQEEEELRNEIEKKMLQQQVQVVSPGSHDLEFFYRTASIYISTSRFEGFPNVILEAMSHGLPCVAFDCPTGPRHIIKHNEDGILVENENISAMAEAVKRLIGNETFRKQLAENAIKNINRFSPANVLRKWRSILNEQVH